VESRWVIAGKPESGGHLGRISYPPGKAAITLQRTERCAS
jgi:hypothetical protein